MFKPLTLVAAVLTAFSLNAFAKTEREGRLVEKIRFYTRASLISKRLFVCSSACVAALSALAGRKTAPQSP